MKKHFEVVAAVITDNSSGNERFFCAQRGEPKNGRPLNETNYKWEFPGGKIEEGESFKEAVEREIFEEFGAKIKAGDFIATVNHEYSDFSITMHAFYCKLVEGELGLSEHLDSKWLLKDELMTLEWAAADVDVIKAII